MSHLLKRGKGEAEIEDEAEAGAESFSGFETSATIERFSHCSENVFQWIRKVEMVGFWEERKT